MTPLGKSQPRERAKDPPGMMRNILRGNVDFLPEIILSHDGPQASRSTPEMSRRSLRHLRFQTLHVESVQFVFEEIIFRSGNEDSYGEML